MNRISASVWTGFTCAAALAFASGCKTPPDGPPPDAAAAVRPVVALRGEQDFFDGRVAALVTVGRGRRVPGGGPGSADGREAGGRHRGPPPGDGIGEGPGGPGGGNYHVLSRPPVTLEVSLRNRSDAPVDIEIRDVNSALGNFAVRPEHLLLAPDAESSLDPMVSRLADVGDEVPVTISLRLAGKTETRIVTLHLVETARERP